jgi:hypothetical protein
MVLTPDEIETIILDRTLTGFAVDTGYSDLSMRFWLQELCDIRERHILWCRFSSNISPKAKVPDDWTVLIECLFSRWSSIGGWQYATSYLGWQGCMTKSSYDCNLLGMLPPGFRLYPDPDWDGLFERRTFIDISKNPGRSKELIIGVNFYPTAEIWLGPHFWQYAKCTKEEALAADFWLEMRDTPHFTYFKCWPTAFTRPDGEQGRMQQRLWKLFFHEDCEWPPGSGTICDEPMYGPPELMPDYQQPTHPNL